VFRADFRCALDLLISSSKRRGQSSSDHRASHPKLALAPDFGLKSLRSFCAESQSRQPSERIGRGPLPIRF
jgi:hypothetical protein